MLIFII